MMVLITYDVGTATDGGKRRLRRVARACQDYGQRVQFSVFECEVDPAQWVKLRDRLLKEIEPERDSLRFYHLGANWKGKVEHLGAKPALDLDGPLVF
ncbi:MAG: CRISPR-associated endonuclease Cas2 [Hyphomicrobium sp. 32-62-53]|nr:MAG: CRISPR-associated endonuclease Cas2 [Hyphomicrobium sp. 12-62-95]OYY01770.1 MAG: CRISPR-associated endonuclease Cas2 [Hyphomicrobium sp. 32-62-53]